MQFIKDHDLYKVARITGPTHNLLIIRLSENVCDTKITPLPIKEGQISKLQCQEVLAQVLAGIDEINHELASEYFVSEVQFLPSDSEPVSIYKYLVKVLVKRIDSNNEFLVL